MAQVKDTKQFWSHLPYQICNNDHVAASPAKDDSCWNGAMKAKFVSPTRESFKISKSPGSTVNTIILWSSEFGRWVDFPLQFGLRYLVSSSFSIHIFRALCIFPSFYCRFSCYISLKKPELRCLHICFWWTQQSKCLLHFHLRRETGQVSETPSPTIPDNR